MTKSIGSGFPVIHQGFVTICSVPAAIEVAIVATLGGLASIRSDADSIDSIPETIACEAGTIDGDEVTIDGDRVGL